MKNGNLIYNVFDRIGFYIIMPATLGALASSGYNDITPLEGVRQTVLAGLPLAVILAPLEYTTKISYFAEKHRSLFSTLCAGLFAGLYFLGGLGIESLIQTEINQDFTSVTGGLAGLIGGLIISIPHNPRKFKGLKNKHIK